MIKDLIKGIFGRNGLPKIEKTNIDLIAKVQSDLDRISFKPSCLNFGWGWKVEPVFNSSGEINGFYIYSGFNRPDTHTGKISRGYGRPWAISLNYGEKELYMTGWMAIEQIIKHELLEAFCVDGARVFDPHKSLDDLVYPDVREKKCSKNIAKKAELT